MPHQFTPPPFEGRGPNSLRLLLLSGLVVLAAALRVVPHPPNFAPVGAIALFGGACFPSRRLAFLLPLSALFLSDLILGFRILVPVVYGSFAINVLLGCWLGSRRRLLPLALVTLTGSILFFVVTNFASWLLWHPHTLGGFVTCYVAAFPFFQNTVLCDLTFVAGLFGTSVLVDSRFSMFRKRTYLRLSGRGSPWFSGLALEGKPAIPPARSRWSKVF